MRKPDVEEFARLLVAHVRDEAISSCDRDLDPAAHSVSALRWHKALRERPCVDAVREIIPDCIDEALFYLLRAIDEGLLPMRYVASSGRVVDLTVEGESEMAGWLAGKTWTRDYSNERFNDDFADMDNYKGPSSE